MRDSIPNPIPDKRFRILIVEDNEGQRETLSLRLVRDGYDTLPAGDAREAYAQLDTAAPDLVLLDIKLPGVSGFDVLARARQTRAMLDLPIIMLSGIDDKTEVVHALRSGANDYVAKPIDFGVLGARIKTQLTLKHFKELNDKLLGIASHDLKKPLLVIRDIARTISEDYRPGAVMDADGAASLQLLMQTAEYMQHVVEQSLDLRAIESGHIRLTRVSTDLNELARQTIERNSSYARKKNISLKSELAPALPAIKADDFRLTQVLDNLIGNAIKFSPPGTAALVRTHAEDGRVLVEISDRGPGVSDEDRARLFTEYARLKNRGTGGESSTGLGLAICHELIRLHGGEIGARNNTSGGGSTFWFRLPTNA